MDKASQIVLEKEILKMRAMKANHQSNGTSSDRINPEILTNR
jgi:hypothetical protein